MLVLVLVLNYYVCMLDDVRARRQPIVRYLASTISGDIWAALVVEDEAVSELDRWALAVVDVSPGANSSATLPLVPRDISGTISISGLGLA